TPAAGQARPDPDHKIVRSAPVMGTRVTVTIRTDDEAKAVRAINDVFEEFHRIDRMMTTWTDDSDISRVNAAAGQAAVKVSPEVLRIAHKAQEASRWSHGAFDITVG